MARFEQESHSFVVRLWREYQAQSDGDLVWRGWVEHVQSGERYYFQNMKDLHTAVSHYIKQIPNLETVFSSIQDNDEISSAT